MAMRVCSVAGCPEIYDVALGSRCAGHRREADKARGTKHQRGYSSSGHVRFRRDVLARDPLCVLCHVRPSTVADHYPVSRRDLVARGLNADDPARGRGLCKPCHDSETAKRQPGGWHRDSLR